MSRDLYEGLQAQHREAYETAKQQSFRLSMARLAYFVVWMSLLVLAFQYHVLAGVALLYVGIYGFGRLLRYHDGVQKAVKIHERSIQLCAEELRIAQHDFAHRPDGEDLAEADHPYAGDMDIFSPSGLFALINRGRTTMGRQRLARYFLEYVPAEVALERQTAALELEGHPEWLLRFQAEGFDIQDTASDIALIQRWLGAEDRFIHRPYLQWLSYILPLLTIGSFVALWYYFSFLTALLALLPAALLLNREKKNVDELQQYVNRSGDILAGYSDMIAHVEEASFQSPLLRRLLSRFDQEPRASTGIARLGKLVDNLNVRYNIFGIVLNVFTMWEWHWVWKLETWRARHRKQVPELFGALAEIEALCSVASLGIHHPEWVVPTFEGVDIVGEQIGHPLIDPAVRVCNDYRSPSQHHVHLVTGSNMGGKSTFLRTVGTQMVLAYMGARVCAARWVMPPAVELFSSMRTQDALQESTSGFYAELRKIEVLIQRARAGRPIFYLLDEVLKGTNTKDRTKGAAALIRQLVGYTGAGMISTHDVGLASLADELGDRLSNVCFEVAVEGDRLTFDYKMREGVSQSFNATQLMRQIGIEGLD